MACQVLRGIEREVINGFSQFLRIGLTLLRMGNGKGVAWVFDDFLVHIFLIDRPYFILLLLLRLFLGYTPLNTGMYLRQEALLVRLMVDFSDKVSNHRFKFAILPHFLFYILLYPIVLQEAIQWVSALLRYHHYSREALDFYRSRWIFFSILSTWVSCTFWPYIWITNLIFITTNSSLGGNSLRQLGGE